MEIYVSYYIVSIRYNIFSLWELHTSRFLKESQLRYGHVIICSPLQNNNVLLRSVILNPFNSHQAPLAYHENCAQWLNREATSNNLVQCVCFSFCGDKGDCLWQGTMGEPSASEEKRFYCRGWQRRSWLAKMIGISAELYNLQCVVLRTARDVFFLVVFQDDINCFCFFC